MDYRPSTMDFLISDLRLTILDWVRCELFTIPVSRKGRKGEFAKAAELQKIVKLIHRRDTAVDRGPSTVDF